MKEDTNAQRPARRRDPSKFSAFLKSTGPSTAGQGGASLVPALAAEGGPSPPRDDQIVVTVVFGTEFGFSKEIAEKLCSMLRETGAYW